MGESQKNITGRNDTVPVSIVIPVYNAEKYLCECMDTVVRQSLGELQIICVDDGSTDRSVQILEGYAQNDQRIEIWKEAHKGAASARNLGMEHARGRYICFLDSDDIFELDMIEEMYRSIEKYEAEIAICNFDTNPESKTADFLDGIERQYMCVYSEKPFCIRELPANAFTMWGVTPWTRLYRLEFLQDKNLKFQEIPSANDVYFSVMSMIYADRMVHVSDFKALVHYRTGTKGQISAGRKVMNTYLAWKKVYGELQTVRADRTVCNQYIVGALLTLITELMKEVGDEEEKRRFYDFFVKEGMEQIGLNHSLEEKEYRIYQEIQEGFQKNSFESQWYREKKGICILLEQKGTRELKRLCREKKAALWGLGINGLAVLQIFEREKINLAGIVDSDTRKQGEHVSGYAAGSFDEMKNGLDLIIITSKRAFNSIFADIEKYENGDLEILPLFLWLESGKELKDCILTVNKIKEMQVTK